MAQRGEKLFITTRNKVVSDIVERKSRRNPDNGNQSKMIRTSDLDENSTAHIAAWDAIKNASRKNQIRKFKRPRGDFYTHKKLVQKYPNETWIGNRCFIIGGGPSLKGFDFKQLNGELTIAVNRAFEFIEDPSIIFFMDNETFYEDLLKGQFGDAAANKFMTSRALKIALNLFGHNFGHGTYSVPLTKKQGFTTELKDGLFHGGNSGFAALNLAICLRANPIYLLGFDMKGDGKGKQAHFHSGYRQVQGERVYKAFKKSFEKAAPLLDRLGIKVINLNPKSELKCFEFEKFDEIYPDIGYKYIPAFDARKLIPHKHKSLSFHGVLGLGDNLYQRPIIKELSKEYKTIYLNTCFPEIYWDIPNIKFVYPEPLNLRTQKNHVLSLPKKTWSTKPKNTDSVRWDQLGPPSQKKVQTKYVELENREDFDFSFPLKNKWIRDAEKVIEELPLDGKKLCIIRRPTNRREWPCPSRNPKIEYFQLLMDKYKDEYFFLSIADIKTGAEWFDGNLTGVDKKFDKGELPLTTILALMKLADMTITFPGFFMIAAIAIRAKCFCIFGGVAAPSYVLRKNLGLQNFGYIAPDPFCNCHKMNHKCRKEIPEKSIISSFQEISQREKVLNEVSVGCPPGIGDTFWVMTKMKSFKERHGIDRLKVVVHRDPIHFYTSDFLKLLPIIDAVVGNPETFSIGHFYRDTHGKNLENPGVMDINSQGVDYLIDPGAQMWIKGTHLMDVLPQYETDYDVEINIPESSLLFADMLKEKNDGKMVLFYTSSLGNNRNWNQNDFKIKDWMSLLNKIHDHSGIRPIAIGAEWDRDYTKELKALDENNIIQDFVGNLPIHQTLALIKQSKLLLGFPCGVPMFGVYNKIPTVIFWAINGISSHGNFDPAFMYSWAPLGTKESGLYFPVAYKSKEATPGWIFNKVKKFL